MTTTATPVALKSHPFVLQKRDTPTPVIGATDRRMADAPLRVNIRDQSLLKTNFTATAATSTKKPAVPPHDPNHLPGPVGAIPFYGNKAAVRPEIAGDIYCKEIREPNSTQRSYDCAPKMTPVIVQTQPLKTVAAKRPHYEQYWFTGDSEFGYYDWFILAILGLSIYHFVAATTK